MNRKTTMADVAKMANVSKSTVSQYINNRFNYMSDSTKVRIKEAIEFLHYVPNQTAKSLKQKSTRTIGVIVANVLHEFSKEIIRAIEDEALLNGFQVFICNADDDSDKERDYIEILTAKQVDGLIICPTPGNYEYYNQLKGINFPVVFIDRTTDENIYPSILLNNMEASRLAVDNFLQEDIYEIGIILPSIVEGITPRIERLEGFKMALEQRDIKLKPEWIVSGNDEEINDAFNGLYNNNNLPRAFFTVNNASLIELLKFLKSKRLKIMKDISIITVDDSIYLDLLDPPISVIKQPTIEMGKAATLFLLRLIKEETLKEEYKVERFPPTLKLKGLI